MKRQNHLEGMRQFAEEPPVEARLGEALRARDESLAIAETCTGGAASTLVTAVPGASNYFDRAFVPYSYDSLRDSLGIERETLDRHGVVSERVTRQLARRARDVAGAVWGVSTTGVAGPAGGDEDTPVGTGYIGVAYAGPWETERSYATVERREFEGDRASVRERIARSALERLLEAVESKAEP